MKEETRINYSTLMRTARKEDFKEIGEKIRNELIPKQGKDFEVYLETEIELGENENLITHTKSLCPECYALLNAAVYERDGKVWIKKICPKHGETVELYWGDYQLYERARKWVHDGKGIWNPNVKVLNACPLNCGLCERHKSHSALINLVATNRCDMNCWYCFFFAEKAGYVYEPSLEHIRYMLSVARGEKPVPGKALQITGGEPALRGDAVEIVKMAKEMGFTHIQFNTNGVRLALEPGFAKQLREAGVNTVYLSFDGVTPKTNPKNHWEIPYALENCKKVSMGVVLVPTVIKGVNDHELGAIIKFAIKHNDIVRGVNFQPVSLTGRVPREEREKLRITIPDAIQRIEEQTNGQVTRDDWYTIPVVTSITHMVEALTGKPEFELTNHFACGMATYVFRDGEKMVPLPRFLDAEALLKYMDEKAEEIKNGGNKYVVMLKIFAKLNSFVKWEKAPRELKGKRKFLKMLYDVFVRHDYKALGEIHMRSLFLGMMHFMDCYNYDQSRVERCNIHYVSPDGRIIPFCTYNVLPQFYRDRVQRVYGIPIEKWEKTKGAKLSSQLYRRDIDKLMDTEIYRKYYEGFV